MTEKKIFKPNVVSVVEIHGCQYYVGCHCHKKKIRRCEILEKSGNPLMVAYLKKLITHQEYLENCKLVHVEEYDTKEEALNREAELIDRFKVYYGKYCLNQSKGNKYGSQGVFPSKETRKKIGKSSKGRNINSPYTSRRVQQFSLDNQFIAEYPSIAEASRQTNTLHSSICLCCRGRYKSAGNSIWKYAN